VFALRLLLPGGGGGYTPTKNYAPGTAAAPGCPPPLLFFRGAKSDRFDAFKLQQQKKKIHLQHLAVFRVILL
ncbi:hypothetical protein ACVGWU_09270, partial [Enterobacter intestinihominis]